MTAHRLMYWGTLAEQVEADSTPYQEGLKGPDIVVIRQMRDLTDWWMQGAGEVKQLFDGLAGDQAAPLLGTAGYTAAY